MKDQNYAGTKTTEIRLARRLPEYWRVTFDHPPLNIFGPEMLPQVNEIITAIETDEQVKVVVFDSVVEGFFLIHLDFLANLDELAHLPPGPTGLHPWNEMLVRLSRSPVVSIASIRLLPGSPPSTNRQSRIPSAWSTSLVCRLISKSNPGGMLALLRWRDRLRNKESKR